MKYESNASEGPPGPQPNIEPFINQMQTARGGEKGPEPFSYMQAQVGPVGPRGSAGKTRNNLSTTATSPKLKGDP